LADRKAKITLTIANYYHFYRHDKTVISLLHSQLVIDAHRNEIQKKICRPKR